MQSVHFRPYVDLDDPGNSDRVPTPPRPQAAPPMRRVDSCSDSDEDDFAPEHPGAPAPATGAVATGAGHFDPDDSDEEGPASDAGSTTQIQRIYPPGLMPHLLNEKDGYFASPEALGEVTALMKRDNCIDTSARSVQWFCHQTKEGVYANEKKMPAQARALRLHEQQLVCQVYSSELDADHPGHMDKNAFYRADKCIPGKASNVPVSGADDDLNHTATVAGHGIGVWDDENHTSDMTGVDTTRDHQLPDHPDHFVDSDRFTSKLYPNLITSGLMLGKWDNPKHCDNTKGGIFSHRAQDDEAILDKLRGCYCIGSSGASTEDFARQCILVNSCKTLCEAKGIPELLKMVTDMTESPNADDQEAGSVVGSLMTDAYRVLPALRKALCANDIFHFWEVKVGKEYLFVLRDAIERMLPVFEEIKTSTSEDNRRRMDEVEDEIAVLELDRRASAKNEIIEAVFRNSAVEDKFAWFDHRLGGIRGYQPDPSLVVQDNGVSTHWTVVQQLFATFSSLESMHRQTDVQPAIDAIVAKLRHLLTLFEPKLLNGPYHDVYDREVDNFLASHPDFEPISPDLLAEREAFRSNPVHSTVADAIAHWRSNDDQFDADCRHVLSLCNSRGALVCQLPIIVKRACDRTTGNGLLAQFFSTGFEYANKFHRLPSEHRSMLKKLRGIASLLNGVSNEETCLIDAVIDHFKKVVRVVKTFEETTLDQIAWLFLKGTIEMMINHSISAAESKASKANNRTCNLNENGLPVYGVTPQDRDPPKRTVKVPIFAKPHVYLSVARIFSDWAEHLNMLQTVKRKLPDSEDMTDVYVENRSKRVKLMKITPNLSDAVVDQILAIVDAANAANAAPAEAEA